MLASPNQPSRRNRRHGEIMYTTLNAIRKHQPCPDGWEKLLKHLGKTKPDDEPLSLLTILESNGLDHALWCFRAVEGFKKDKQLLAITYAREVEHLMPAESKKALDVFERYANGLATEEEFDAARRGGDAAAYTAAHTACGTAWSAVWAARAAAWAAAADAAAARAAAWAAVPADAYSVVYAAAAADRAAARSTIQAKQETQFIQLLKDSAKGES